MPRLSKQDLTIPRFELVACHMSVNLLHNAKKALTGHPLRLIRGKGCYKYFVKNRAVKIREKKEILNSTGNPADIGSRGMSVAKMGQL